MLRLLLSLLALMSGLTAVGPGGEARAYAASGTEIASVLQDGAGARVSAHVVAHAQEITRPAQPRLTFHAAAPMAQAPRAITVRLPVDRARE